jgi:16S rRNA (cytidine1402-2'-O)-methyltransferase
MPAISDPGYELVVAAQQRGFGIVPIPGSSAFVTALAVSGLPTNACLYLGFLPRKAGARRRLLESVVRERATLAVYEAPHRLQSSLRDILDVLGNRNIAVCRELTKLHEEIFRGTVEDAIGYFVQPRGELTVIIGGYGDVGMEVAGDQLFRLKKLKNDGLSAKEALEQFSYETGMSRRELYREWLKLK